MLKICNDVMDMNRVNEAARFLKVDGLNIVAEKAGNLCGYVVENKAGEIRVQYGAPCDFFRSLLYISQEGALDVSKDRKFENLGYMVDVARDAVPKIDTLKKLALYLAILGYNRLYVYLEDLFEVKGEPFFGYLRGRYTEEELKELDDYCAGFGIELVPCLQTLAHLNGIFGWPEYKRCNDVADILLVGDERTYQLIQNMFETVSRVFRTKTLHIGMDEAHMVGRGKYLDVNGYKRGYEVVAEHIQKVVELAKPFGFDLRMWSDMYFRLAFGGGYYSAEGVLPKEILERIPKEVSLVYWDYYSRDKALVAHMIEEHLKTGNQVSFAGGAWKWNGVNPDTEMSFLTSKVALETCKEYGIKDIMLTAWGDDGAEGSIFSTLPVIAYYAESGYSDKVDEENIDKLLKGLFGLTLEDFFSADMLIVDKEQFEENYLFWKLPKMLLYNDPLVGARDWMVEKYKVESNLKAYAERLKRTKKNAPAEFKYIFTTIESFCKVLELKATLGLDVRRAYQANDLAALRSIAKKRIPCLIKRVQAFEKAFFAQWMLENKDNGYHTHDNRLWGLIKRLQTTKVLIEEFIKGKRTAIYELQDGLLTLEGDDALNTILW